eukprot:scaffold13053_cov108-Skeletonema_dohrnii-CCMP3373.AAC.1
MRHGSAQYCMQVSAEDGMMYMYKCALTYGDEIDESGLPCGTEQSWTFDICTFLWIIVQVIIVIDFRIGTIKRQKLLLLAVVSLVHASLAALIFLILFTAINLNCTYILARRIQLLTVSTCLLTSFGRVLQGRDGGSFQATGCMYVLQQSCYQMLP